MKFEQEKINGNLDGNSIVTVYTGFLKKEIGFIRLISHSPSNYYKIEFFKVREKYRRKHIGKDMLSRVVEDVKAEGGTRIFVYPNSDPYDGDSRIEPPILYEIYKNLGFEFTSDIVDLSKPNNEMILTIK